MSIRIIIQLISFKIALYNTLLMAYHKNNALDLFNDFRSLFSYYGEVPFWSGLIKYCNFYELNGCIDARPFLICSRKYDRH